MCFNFFGTSLHTPIREGEVLYLSFFILLKEKLMKILIYKKNEFEVYITNSSIVIINTEGKYENHAHLTKVVDSAGKVKLTTTKALINIVIKKKVPKSNYLVTSAIRLTTDDEYRDNLIKILDKRKRKKYVNKGVRK